MARSLTDRLLSVLLDVAETTKNTKLKLKTIDTILLLRANRPSKGRKPAPKPLTETERLLGTEKKD